MRKIFLIVFVVIFSSCNKNDNIYDDIEINCDKVYFYKSKDSKIEYYCFVISLLNNSKENVIIKKNEKVKESKFINLDLEFTMNHLKLHSPFVEGYILDSNFIVYKGRVTKVIYLLEIFNDEKFNGEIIIKNSNNTYSNKIEYDKEVIPLDSDLDIEEAIKLLQK